MALLRHPLIAASSLMDRSLRKLHRPKPVTAYTLSPFLFLPKAAPSSSPSRRFCLHPARFIPFARGFQGYRPPSPGREIKHPLWYRKTRKLLSSNAHRKLPLARLGNQLVPHRCNLRWRTRRTLLQRKNIPTFCKHHGWLMKLQCWPHFVICYQA